MANTSAEMEATRLVAAPVKGAGEDEELPPALPEAREAVPEGVGLVIWLFDAVGYGATMDVGCSVALSVETTLVAMVEAGAAVVEAAAAVLEA